MKIFIKKHLSRRLAVASLSFLLGGCAEYLVVNAVATVAVEAANAIDKHNKSSSTKSKQSTAQTSVSVPKGYCIFDKGNRIWASESECRIKNGVFRTQAQWTQETIVCRIAENGGRRYEVLTGFSCRSKGGYISVEANVSCQAGSTSSNQTAFRCMKQDGVIVSVLEANVPPTVVSGESRKTEKSGNGECHFGGGIISANKSECFELEGAWR